MDFQSEYQELLRWWVGEMDKIPDIPWEGGLDGERSWLEMNLGAEYRRRLRILKRKYNMLEETQDTSSAKDEGIWEKLIERYKNYGSDKIIPPEKEKPI